MSFRKHVIQEHMVLSSGITCLSMLGIQELHAYRLLIQDLYELNSYVILGLHLSTMSSPNTRAYSHTPYSHTPVLNGLQNFSPRLRERNLRQEVLQYQRLYELSNRGHINYYASRIEGLSPFCNKALFPPSQPTLLSHATHSSRHTPQVNSTDNSKKHPLERKNNNRVAKKKTKMMPYSDDKKNTKNTPYSNDIDIDDGDGNGDNDSSSDYHEVDDNDRAAVDTLDINKPSSINKYNDTPMVMKHRALFMEQAFSNIEQDADENRKSNVRPQSELDEISSILTNWGVGINLKQVTDDTIRKKLTKFRRENKVGAHHITRYHSEEITLPTGERRTILHRIEKNKVGRIVLSRERIFDAINEWHRDGGGHFGQERTWTACRNKYWNCSQHLVRLFCELCPECFQKNPTIKAQKGSRKPIRSRTFRERFQIDLIDMRKLRRRNPYGVLMRWIITIKDHATGYTMIDCIPRKSARFVAHVLQSFFGHVGYPFVFHTDNGKEFTGKAILKCLRRINPNILTITGRPRVPRDQGSVESMNKTVKRVMQAELAQRRMLGEDSNWTEILGSVASSINSQCGRGKFDVPSYNAVFGCMFHQEVCVTKEEARNCWTLTERLQVIVITVSFLWNIFSPCALTPMFL